MSRGKHTHPETDGEIAIKAILKKEKIRFVQESRIPGGKLKGDEKNFRKADFLLPDYGIYIEYLGMWNHEEHRKRYREKMRVYNENKIPCIYLYPNSLIYASKFIKDGIKKLEHGWVPYKVAKEENTELAKLTKQAEENERTSVPIKIVHNPYYRTVTKEEFEKSRERGLEAKEEFEKEQLEREKYLKSHQKNNNKTSKSEGNIPLIGKLLILSIFALLIFVGIKANVPQLIATGIILGLVVTFALFSKSDEENVEEGRRPAYLSDDSAYSKKESSIHPGIYFWLISVGLFFLLATDFIKDWGPALTVAALMLASFFIGLYLLLET